ncbi:hypothetical protein Aph01nite_05020 [Acrocarpospora phusangensis]|uniref:DUF6777 domain-containing protein n=1 Tax=Acrocarpospora phusangensis TaxID=1070424 RepID=A0A919Q4K4_9ACTN|nr:DUF6777 domain-containing protein [Acrocarpospora phusangensis]GIH22192.1 hypothetical protein Aph01nite_05020 [Acrocarpospora phusangensis]
MKRVLAAITAVVVMLGAGAVRCTKWFAEAADIVAVAVDVLGDDPFFEDSLGQDQQVAEPGSYGGAQLGDLPGLYGGTRRKRVCDKERLIEYLTDPKNSTKAEAWARVRGIKVNAIPKYVRKLTSVLLRNDTLVKNHGFREGVETVFEALLEAGIAVLVDERGQPVVKCNCGNPLAEPSVTPADIDPGVIADADWRARFTPEKVTVVKKSKSKRVRRFHLLDVLTGRGIGRPAGADAAKDVDLPRPPEPPEPPEPVELVDATLVGTWRSSGPITALVRVADSGGLTGVLAEDMVLTDSCVVPAGRTVWHPSGRGPEYTGSITSIEVTTCADMSDVEATWTVKDQNTMTMCVVVEPVQCSEWSRT